jgi:hypothetical protein
LDLKPAGGHFGDGEGFAFLLEVDFFVTTTFFLTTGFFAGLAFFVAVTLGDGDLVAP